MPREVTPKVGTTRAERIGSYAVIAELGSGATSRVLLGQRSDEPEVRVLKQLRLELATDSVARMRFQREALLASRLDHPNIAKICWSGIEDGTPCIAMEFVAGQTLARVTSRLAERAVRMPQTIAIPITLGILSGLTYAHELTDAAGQGLGIVHRDLSLDNVMVSYGGQVKIIDFGTARARLDDFRTAPGVRIGTLLYMSPEQAMSMAVDHRSDLYTVSVLLWEMLTGERLVKSEASVDVLEEIAYQVPPLASEIDPTISEELAEVVARGLAKDRDHRWQSAREFSDAVRSEAGTRGDTTSETIGRYLRDLFPEAEAAAARAIELGRQRHFQDHEETLLEDQNPTTLRDELGPTIGDGPTLGDAGPTSTSPAPVRESQRRLPPEPKKPGTSLRLIAIFFITLMIGFTLGLITERAGWWRPPPPGGADLHRTNPR